MSVSSTTTDPNAALEQLSPKQQRKESRRVILSSYLGSSIEYYDFCSTPRPQRSYSQRSFSKI